MQKKSSEEGERNVKESLPLLLKYHDPRERVPRALLGCPGGLWGVSPPAYCVQVDPVSSFFREQIPVVEPCVEPEVEKEELLCSLTAKPGYHACCITWSHGGNKVSLTGSFTNWSISHALPMVRCAGRQYSIIIYLPKGLHQYKFIVDDKLWHYCPKQRQETDLKGNTNNVLDTRNFDPNELNSLSKTHRTYGPDQNTQDSEWGQHIPDLKFLTADCPQVPAILLEAITRDGQSSAAGGMAHMAPNSSVNSGHSALVKRVLINSSKRLESENPCYSLLSNGVVVSTIGVPNIPTNSRNPDDRSMTLTLFNITSSKPSSAKDLRWIL